MRVDHQEKVSVRSNRKTPLRCQTEEHKVYELTSVVSATMFKRPDCHCGDGNSVAVDRGTIITLHVKRHDFPGWERTGIHQETASEERPQVPRSVQHFWT